jgi:pectate lyase
MGHLYNNYFESIRACGVHARGKARLVVENSVFSAIRNPLRRDPKAELVSRGNLLSECTGDNQPGGQGFDPRRFYPYELDDAAKIVDLVKRFAGP